MTGLRGLGSDAEVSEGEDRRRHRRIAVELPGRFLLEDGSEHPCVCLDVSISGLRLGAQRSGPWGSRVLAYIDGLGRIEGYVVRRAPGWFAIESRITPRKGERVRDRIGEILQTLGRATDRRAKTREARRREVLIVTLDGRQHHAELTDSSEEGAALLTEAEVEIGELIRVDGRRGRVARRFPGGLAMAFEDWTLETARRTATRAG